MRALYQAIGIPKKGSFWGSAKTSEIGSGKPGPVQFKRGFEEGRLRDKVAFFVGSFLSQKSYT